MSYQTLAYGTSSRAPFYFRLLQIEFAEVLRNFGMLAYFCHEMQDNNHVIILENCIAINESFLEIFSQQNEKINFKETLIYRNSFPK